MNKISGLGGVNKMTELKTFVSKGSEYKSEKYADANKQANEYAKTNNLNIESVQYDRLQDVVIANVLFSEITKVKQEDLTIQSYRNERRLLFDTFNKETKIVCNIIESLIKCIDKEEYKDIVSKAEEYLVIHKYNKEIINNTADEN